MCADFSLSAPPQRNWFAPIAGGIELAGTLQDQAAKRDWFNYTTQQAKQEQAAIKTAGETGNIQPLMGIDPAKAQQVGKIWDWYQGQKDPVQKDVMRLTANLPSIAPMLNEKSWKTFRPELIKSYPNVPQDALPPENATNDQLFQFGNHAKLMEMAAKAYDPNYLLKVREYTEVKKPVAAARVAQLGASTQRNLAQIQQGWAKIDADKETGGKGGPYNQLLQFHQKIRPGEAPTEESLKDLYTNFSKSGLNFEEKGDREAYKAAINVLSHNETFKYISPDDPRHEAMLTQEVTRQKRLMGIATGKGKPQSTLPLPTTYQGKYGTDSAENSIVWDGTKYVPYTGE